MLENNIHITSLIYDVFDIDLIVFSKPDFSKEIDIKRSFKKRLEWICQLFHSGVFVLFDIQLEEYLNDSICFLLESTAFNDPASPLIQEFKLNENYFYCEFDSSKNIVNNQNSDISEIISFVSKLFRSTR